MPKPFSTQAANADVLTEEGAIPGMPHEIGADGTPRDRSDRRREPEVKAEAKDGQAKPGKDIDASGLVKDKDAAKP